MVMACVHKVGDKGATKNNKHEEQFFWDFVFLYFLGDYWFLFYDFLGGFYFLNKWTAAN